MDVEIIGTRCAARRFSDVVDDLVEAARTGRRRRVHFGTVHSLVEATRNERLARAFGSASMVCLDGMPLVWIARRRGARTAERVCGPDVMAAIAEKGRAQGLRHYFFGGRAGVAEALARSLGDRFPGLTVAGHYEPAFRAAGEIEDDRVIAEINAARPDVVWIGLGSPKQELWAADHEDRLNAPLILPVGAAFDFHSGRLRRAPRWMQRLGLEWLFRLGMDPRRLARRYLVANATFVRLALREHLRRRSSRGG